MKSIYLCLCVSPLSETEPLLELPTSMLLEDMDLLHNLHEHNNANN